MGQRFAKPVWGLIDTHWTQLAHLSVRVALHRPMAAIEWDSLAGLTRLRSLAVDSADYYSLDFSAFTFLTHLKFHGSYDSLDEECAGDRVLNSVTQLTRLRSLETKGYQSMHLSRVASLPLVAFKCRDLGCVGFEGEVEGESIPPMDWISKFTSLRSLSLGSVPSYPSFFEALATLSQLTSLT